MEDALELGPVLVAVYPVLVGVCFDLFELEAGVGVEAEPEPVLPRCHEVTDKQALCCTSQVEHSYYLVDLANAGWTDGTARRADEFGWFKLCQYFRCFAHLVDKGWYHAPD